MSNQRNLTPEEKEQFRQKLAEVRRNNSELNAKIAMAAAQGEEPPVLDKVMQFLSNFARKVGDAAERKINNQR